MTFVISMRSRASSRGRRAVSCSRRCRDAPGEVADTLEVDGETEASEKLTSLVLAHFGDSFRQFVVDLALNAVEFLLAIADRQQSHLGAALDEVPNVVSGVLAYEASAERDGGDLLVVSRYARGFLFESGRHKDLVASVQTSFG